MIYLDNASTTKMDERVLDAMMPYMTDNYGNPGTVYAFGAKAAAAIGESRYNVANLMGANPDQIIFTSGGSEANNLALRGAMEYLKKIGKPHIISSEIEHDSILNTLYGCANGSGITYSLVKPARHDGEIKIGVDEIIEELQRYPNTGLVSIMHTNNETGIVNDVEDIAKLCRERGILFHSDFVQCVWSKATVHDIDYYDFISISSHKIHGCKGAGALYAKNKDILTPIIFGGKMQEFGFRGGTENVPGIVGFGEACKILSDNDDTKQINYLRARLYIEIVSWLEQYGIKDILHINGGVDLLKPGKTFSARFDGIDAETLVLVLSGHGLCISAGSACRSHETTPSRTLLSIGLTEEEAMNSVRFSVSRMNTENEIKDSGEIIATCVYRLYNLNRN